MASNVLEQTAFEIARAIELRGSSVWIGVAFDRDDFGINELQPFLEEIQFETGKEAKLIDVSDARVAELIKQFPECDSY